jgi:hypothetical protein
MLKCLCSFGVALVLLGSGILGAASLAKPPDLPVDVGADFEEVEMSGGVTLGFDLLTGKSSLSWLLPWDVLQSWLPESPEAVEPKAPREERESSTLEQETARKLFEASPPPGQPD